MGHLGEPCAGPQRPPQGWSPQACTLVVLVKAVALGGQAGHLCLQCQSFSCTRRALAEASCNQREQPPWWGKGASWGDRGRTKRHRAVPLHPQAPAGAALTPAPHGYLAGHSGATQKDDEIVGGVFKREQLILAPRHLGSHLLPPSLFLMQLPPQLLLQLPAAKHIDMHTTA